MVILPLDDINSNKETPNSINQNNSADPWLSLSQTYSNSNNQNNMDTELASIVSSLSALSNPSNTLGNAVNNTNNNSKGMNQQIGGFRRNSFTNTSDVDSDILYLNSTNLSYSTNMDHGSTGSPLLQRSTQSVGTAPPYTSNMFNIHYNKNGNNMFNNTLNNTSAAVNANLSNQTPLDKSAAKSKSINLTLNNNANYNTNDNNTRDRLLGQYSASIAGPILQNEPSAYYNNNNNQTGSAQHSMNSASSTRGGGGIFQQLGQSLIEGTKELEFDENQSQHMDSSSGYGMVNTSQATLDNSTRSSDIDEYTDYNSSGTAPNDNPTTNSNMFMNITNAPAFKPNPDFQQQMIPNNQYFMNYPHQNQMFNFPQFPMAGIPQMMYDNNGTKDSTGKDSENTNNNNALPVNNRMFIPPSNSPPQNNINANNGKNPYIYIQNQNVNSPPQQQQQAFFINQKSNMDNSHVNNPMKQNKNKNRKNQNTGQQQHVNPYLDQNSNQTVPMNQHHGKSFNQPQANSSPFSSKNSSDSNTSVSSTVYENNTEATTNQSSNNNKRKNNTSAQQQQPVYNRSPLLEEIRNYSTNNNNDPDDKQYSLKDIFGHTLEFCKDQYGSRFIQKELAISSPSEKEVLFNELREHTVMLSNDVFGNYVIQKFFEFGSKTQKDILVDQFRGRMKELSIQMYACRVIQKALEFIDASQRIELVDELKDCVLKMIKDQNGNHVIQKAIETIPIDLLPFVLKSLIGHIYHLSTHSYGCRVIQRLLEFGSEDDQITILKELKDFIPYLIQDQYGNYVIQYILQHGSDNNSHVCLVQTKQEVINIVSQNVVEFSKHKFASNVVEKAVLYGTKEQKSLIISKILPRDKEHASNLEDNAPMILMMRDQFANYVVQKLVTVTEGDGKKLIVISIRSYLDKLNKSNSLGNRHLASVEKLATLVESVQI